MRKNLLTCHLLQGFLPSIRLKKLFDTYDDCVQELVEIAESVSLSIDQKKELMENLRKSFTENERNTSKTKVIILRKLFDKEGLDGSLYNDMIDACEQNLEVEYISIWEEFLNFGRKKASTIARLVMAAYQENPSTYIPAENLGLLWEIIAILNNLKNYQGRHGRCLIPIQMIEQYDARVTDFSLDKTTKGARATLQEIIQRLEAMQSDVQKLPLLIKNRRLKLKIFVMLSLTNFMIQSMKKNDILQSACCLNCWMWSKAIAHSIYKLIFVGKED